MNQLKAEYGPSRLVGIVELFESFFDCGLTRGRSLHDLTSHGLDSPVDVRPQVAELLVRVGTILRIAEIADDGIDKPGTDVR